MPTETIHSGEFRRNMTDYMLRANRGDTIEVTFYGRPYAVLVPPDWYERAVRALAAAEQNE